MTGCIDRGIDRGVDTGRAIDSDPSIDRGLTEVLTGVLILNDVLTVVLIGVLILTEVLTIVFILTVDGGIDCCIYRGIDTD